MEKRDKQTTHWVMSDKSTHTFTPDNSFYGDKQRQPWSKPKIRIEQVNTTAAGGKKIPDGVTGQRSLS